MTRELPTAAPPADPVGWDTTLSERFARMVGLHPSRPAVGTGSRRPTYAELNAAANRIAHLLLARGARPGDRIALLMRHEAPLAAAAIAVVKIGGVVAPLNPVEPETRLRQYVELIEPRFLLTDAAHRAPAERVVLTPRSVACVDPLPEGVPDGDPRVAVGVDDPAFLIGTSGTAGRPKAVLLTHRALMHNVYRCTRGMELRADDRNAVPALLSTGQGQCGFWNTLLNGACLCWFPSAEVGLTGLADKLREHGVTVLTAAAPVFRRFVGLLEAGERFPAMRLVRLASEAAVSEDVAAFRRHFPDECVLLETYNCSEAGNITQLRLTRADRVADGRLPAGRPAQGLEVLLLDPRGEPVAPGQVGEICVRSRYLAVGYWRNEELTAAKFSGPAEPGALRLYRTGDTGRLDADGLLHLVGRSDARVKIHGYSVEPGEVEEALRRLPGVERAAVCDVPGEGAEVRLAAFVEMRPGSPPSATALRAGLGSLLPAHMMPTSITFVDELPLGPGGKVDRGQLRRAAAAAPAPVRRSSAPPATPEEAAVAAAFSAVFHNIPVGRDDDFFELGGDSLSAAVAAARIHAALGVQLELRDFVEQPSPAALAEVIAKRRASSAPADPPPVRVLRDRPLPPSFMQERLWRRSRMADLGPRLTRISCRILRGPLDQAAFRHALDYAVLRHEALRTTVSEINGVPAQIVHPPFGVPFHFDDLTGRADALEVFRRILEQEESSVMDPQRLPLLRFRLVRLDPQEHRLITVNHHIISDRRSWMTFFGEVGLLYQTRLRGEPPPLPASSSLHYADFAAWQRSVLNPAGARYREYMGWWQAYLAGAPTPAPLPFARARLDLRAPAASCRFHWGIEPAVSRRLDHLGAECGATYFVLRLAGLAALLAHQTGQADTLLLTNFSGRVRAEFHDTFGCFYNSAVLRLKFNPRLSLREWSAQVCLNVAETQARTVFPLEDIFRNCFPNRSSGPPRVRVMFQTADHTQPQRFGDLEMECLDSEERGRPWVFSIRLDQHNERRCRVHFDVREFDPEAVRGFLNRYKRFLDAASSAPDRPLGELLAAGAG